MALRTTDRSLPTSPPDDVHRPLNPTETTRRVLQATAVLIAFYVVALLTLLSMIVLIGLLIVLIVVGTRVGAAAFLKRPLVSLGRQAGLIARSLNLRRGPEYAVALHQEQAPGLFALIETAARQAGVQTPERVLLEMSDNAWVKLRGYRAGRGRCTLGVGYDLLALLTQAELMAVLTHEMAHARLVQRGYTGWLSNGLARLIQFARTLDALDAPKRRGRLHPARMLDQVVTALGKSGARAMAMLSRQDEFAADALAARLCGSETYARTLTTLIMAGRKGRDLTWRDRLVQWQREGTVTDWIRCCRRTPPSGRHWRRRHSTPPSAANGARIRRWQTGWPPCRPPQRHRQAV